MSLFAEYADMRRNAHGVCINGWKKDVPLRHIGKRPGVRFFYTQDRMHFFQLSETLQDGERRFAHKRRCPPFLLSL